MYFVCINDCVLKAKSKEQKQTWCQEIKKLMIESCERCIPDHAKELVLGTKSIEDRLAGNRNRNKTATRESSKSQTYQHLFYLFAFRILYYFISFYYVCLLPCFAD